MREDNFELTKAVERVLDEMIADGTLDAIIARWL
jgi:ABC-type amino acid transport substrate-binding protein